MPRERSLCFQLTQSNIPPCSFAGLTECAVATLNGNFALVPLSHLVNRASIVSVAGHVYGDLVRSTGQPDFISADDLACDDLAVETPAGGCVVSYDGDDVDSPV